MNVQSPHKWWSTLKSAVFDLSSPLPLLVSEGGGLVCESVGKADLLSDHFDSKQSREAVDLPLICHPSLSFTTFAFKSSEVRRLLVDLDPYRGTDPLCMFNLFLKRTADVIARRLSVVFRRFVCLGSFPACWRQANVTPIPKDPPSCSVAKYRQIFIISALSKVFIYLFIFYFLLKQNYKIYNWHSNKNADGSVNRFASNMVILNQAHRVAWCLSTKVFEHLDHLWNAVVCFQPPSLLIGKVLVPLMHFCACSIHCRVH